MKTPRITKSGLLMSTEKQVSHFYLDSFSTSYRLIAYGQNKRIIKGNLYEYAEISGLFFEDIEPCIWVTKVSLLHRGNIEYSLLDPFYINSNIGYVARNEVNGYL